MRNLFKKCLLHEMEKNSNIIFITGDLGYGVWDDIQEKFPERYLNCGSSEQLMVSMAVGACLEGKIPIVFSITSFLLYRPFEVLRTYVNHENHPIKLIGGNRDYEYKFLGISHYAHDSIKILSTLENIVIFKPETAEEMYKYFNEIIYNNKPSFLSLKK
jgi:transketolase